jgi:hypothetical protein
MKWCFEALEQTKLAKELIQHNDNVIREARIRADELSFFADDMIVEKEGRRQQLEGRED